MMAFPHLSALEDIEADPRSPPMRAFTQMFLQLHIVTDDPYRLTYKSARGQVSGMVVSCKIFISLW